MAYKAIRLDSGGGLAATLVPDVGMIGVSLVFDGEEHLDQREGIDQYVEHASTMGLPILYPWANRLSRDSWKFDGQQVMIETDAYQVKRDENGYPIHGTLAATPLWQVEAAQADDDLGSASVRATLEFDGHTQLFATFPFPHRLELEYRVTGDELRVTTTVTPTGEVAVPLAYGFHPYITLPGSERQDWRVRLPGMIGLKTDKRHIPTGNTHLDRAADEPLGDRDLDDAFSGVAEGAEFSVSDATTAVTVSFDRGYPAAQVYSPAGADFICFEPMKSPVNALITGRDLASVQPGETDVSEFTIRIGPAPEELDQTKSNEDARGEDETGESTGPPEVVPTEAPPPPEAESVTRFRLDPTLDPVDEVRRVARGRTDSAVSFLRAADPKSRARAVHTARKDMKKLRAILRLVRDELGKKTYRNENRRFRDAARKLSDARDAEVLTGTVESLLDRYPDDSPSLDGFRSDLDRRRDEAAGHTGEDSVENHIAEAVDEISAGAEAINAWPLTRSGWKLFEPGLRRSYRDGRSALAEIESDPEPTEMHEFRKRVKDLWYELRLLRDVWPEGLEGVVGEASLLSELLGDFNDLSVLRDDIDVRDEEGEDLSILSEVAAGRQAELFEKAMPVARRLYTEKPSAFTARIGGYWSAGKSSGPA